MPGYGITIVERGTEECSAADAVRAGVASLGWAAEDNDAKGDRNDDKLQISRRSVPVGGGGNGGRRHSLALELRLRAVYGWRHPRCRKGFDRRGSSQGEHPLEY